MAINQNAFNALPHRHNVVDVMGLQQAMNGQEGRTEKPFCEVVYGSSFQLGTNANVPMGGGFVTVKDNALMVWHPGTGSGQTDKLRVRIPFSAYYEVSWQYYIDGVGTSVPTATVTKNGSNTTANAVAVGQGAANGWAAPHATVIRSFNGGDHLYFFAWHNSVDPRTVHGYWFGEARTRIVVRYVGPL